MAEGQHFPVLHAGAHSSSDRVHKSNPQGSSGQTQANAGPSTATQRSCMTCRKRKVKCDKNNPCSNCQKARIECVFPNPVRVVRRPRKPAEGELLERLKKLEGALQSLGAQVEEERPQKTQETPHAANQQVLVENNVEEFKQWRKVGTGKLESTEYEGIRCSDGKSPVTTPDGNTGDVERRFGRLVVGEGKSRYVNTSFWANLNEEVEDLKGIIQDRSEDEEDIFSPESPSESSSHQGFIFGFSSTNVDMLKFHPHRAIIPRIWDLFKQNVDPLIKLLHTPTIEPKIFDAMDHLDNLPRGIEALMFAIYYGVATSLLPEECFQEFGESQQVLLKKYRFALEQALARANCLDSEEIVVLQAFVIYLIVLRRNDDGRMIWTLTGLVVRIAQTLGIHRDGSHFDISPFEIEMRRRLWWQVCILDARAAGDHGCDPTIVEAQFDTQMPLNIDDADISPDMKELPESRKGFTEMTFCLIRFEVANIFRRILYVPPGPVRCNTFLASLSTEQKEKWINECHQRMEETYLRDVDLSIPLFWVTATLSRLMLSKLWLVVYHPYQRLDMGASLPQEKKDKLFLTSLESIEYGCLLENDRRTKKWGWLFRTYVQWHCIAFLLSELCVRTSGPLVQRAWHALEETVKLHFGNATSDSKRTGLWRPLVKLMAKARRVRHLEQVREMQALGIQGFPTEGFPIEGFPAIDAFLSRGSGHHDSPQNANSGIGGHMRRINTSESPVSSGGAASTPGSNVSYGNNPSIQPQYRHTGPTTLPSQERSIYRGGDPQPGVDRASMDHFTNMANQGLDWLIRDLVDPGALTTPDLTTTSLPSNPALTMSPISANGDGSGSLSGAPSEEMNWESWDNLVRDISGVPANASNLNTMGMTSWL